MPYRVFRVYRVLLRECEAVSYLALAKRVVAEHEAEIEGGRCAGCRRHEARGVRVLNCSECGYMAPRRIPQLTEEDLRYPLEFVRQEVPTFAEPYRTRYRAWVKHLEELGWEGEHAEQAAFRRILRWRRPLRRPFGGGRERQMKLVGERGEPASG